MQTSQQKYDRTNNDEIDLRDLIAIFIRNKWLIAVLIIVGGVLGAGASLFSTKYDTEGFFLIPNVSLDEYKRYKRELLNGTRFERYLKDSGQEASAEGKLLGKFSKSLGKMISPVFVFTEQDQKHFGIKVDEKERNSDIIGMYVTFSYKEPTMGKPIILLGEYIRNVIMLVNMEDTMFSMCHKYQISEKSRHVDQIKNDFAILQEQNYVTSLRNIMELNSDASAVGDHLQTLLLSPNIDRNMEKETERFLPISVQLIGAEIKIANLKREGSILERSRIADVVKRDYYCQAQQILQNPISSKALIDELEKIQNRVFEGKDKSSGANEEVWTELSIEREKWASNYLTIMRFIGNPAITETKTQKIKLISTLLLGGVLGALFGITTAFFRSWWRDELRNV